MRKEEGYVWNVNRVERLRVNLSSVCKNGINLNLTSCYLNVQSPHTAVVDNMMSSTDSLTQYV